MPRHNCVLESALCLSPQIFLQKRSGSGNTAPMQVS